LAKNAALETAVEFRDHEERAKGSVAVMETVRFADVPGMMGGMVCLAP
jgi:hypothetical protein